MRSFERATDGAEIIPFAPFLERARARERAFIEAVQDSFRPRRRGLVALIVAVSVFCALATWELARRGAELNAAEQQVAAAMAEDAVAQAGPEAGAEQAWRSVVTVGD